MTRTSHDALQGFAVGSADREQDIHTPIEILDVCRRMWGGVIPMDPCATPQRLIAKFNLCGTQLPPIPGRKFGMWVGDGLKTPWLPGTFINPPFRDLEVWMDYARTQNVEQIMLCPVRTHRVWWIAYAEWVDAIAWLSPFCFHNYDQSFPVPCVLLYKGSPDLVPQFREACRDIAIRVTGPLL